LNERTKAFERLVSRRRVPKVTEETAEPEEEPTTALPLKKKLRDAV
jgi:hypothetical protein